MPTTSATNNRVITLINDSTARIGSASKLAPAIGYTRHDVSAWIHGSRPCPVEAQALMGAIAGRDVDQVIREALLERNAGTARGEKLVSALGKGLMASGAVTLSLLPDSAVLASNLPGILRCIFWVF